jgi:hypothetical protein
MEDHLNHKSPAENFQKVTKMVRYVFWGALLIRPKQGLNSPLVSKDGSKSVIL